MLIVSKVPVRVVARRGNTPDYPTADYLIAPSNVAALEAASVPEKYWKLNGPVETCDNVEEMTAAEKTAVDDSAEYLAPEKARRLAEINDRTDALILLGFEFPAASGNIFGLTDKDITVWSNLYLAKDLLTFPKIVGTIDFDDYEIADIAAATAFYGTGLATVETHKGAGQVYRKAVRDATTRAEVDAVVDTR